MNKLYFAKLLPIQGENQCDGCKAGYPVKDGVHKVPYPSGSMVCQAKKYSKLFLCSRDNPDYKQEILTEGIKEGQEFTEKEAEYLSIGK